jgi:hypothetical protein
MNCVKRQLPFKRPYVNNGTYDVTNPFYYGATTSFPSASGNRPFDGSPFDYLVRKTGNAPDKTPLKPEVSVDAFFKKDSREYFPVANYAPKPFDESPFAELINRKPANFYYVNNNTFTDDQVIQYMSTEKSSSEDLNGVERQRAVTLLPLIMSKFAGVSTEPITVMEEEYLRLMKIHPSMEGIKRYIERLPEAWKKQIEPAIANIPTMAGPAEMPTQAPVPTPTAPRMTITETENPLFGKPIAEEEEEEEEEEMPALEEIPEIPLLPEEIRDRGFKNSTIETFTLEDFGTREPNEVRKFFQDVYYKFIGKTPPSKFDEKLKIARPKNKRENTVNAKGIYSNYLNKGRKVQIDFQNKRIFVI